MGETRHVMENLQVLICDSLLGCGEGTTRAHAEKGRRRGKQTQSEVHGKMIECE